MRIFFWIVIALTFAGPIYILLSGNIDFSADYRTANRDSAKIAPLPNETHEAVIQVYSARTFNWRGLFAIHTWIAMKPKNAKQYTVMHVIGWRLFMNKPPLVIMEDIPDRIWFDQKPDIILDIRGAKAEALIPKILEAANRYPYPNSYSYWPGPNSNTFTAYIGREVPELGMVLPGTAIGKDYLTNAALFAIVPSGTGYQFSLKGLVGIGLARKEGFEVNLLGLVYGIRFAPLGIILPGFGGIPTYKVIQQLRNIP
jgi:hypothetical protein